MSLNGKTCDLVLGGGVTGLTWAFYNNSTIITKDIGGQQSNGTDLGPRYLHVTPETEQFMNDLGLSTKTRTIKVGYMYNYKCYDMPTEQMIKDYYYKSRGVEYSGDPTTMTSKKNEFEAFDVPMSRILGRLVKKVKHVEVGTVTKIDLDVMTVHTSLNDGSFSCYYCDSLVSTIPLDIFMKLCGFSPTGIEAETVLFSVVDDIGIDDLIGNNDYMYFPGPDFPFYRATRIKGSKIVLEYLRKYITNSSALKICRTSKQIVVARSQIKPVNIAFVDKDMLTGLNNLKLVGRYGAWNRDYKLDRVVKEAQEASK